jgi:hypothetical protein
MCIYINAHLHFLHTLAYALTLSHTALEGKFERFQLHDLSGVVGAVGTPHDATKTHTFAMPLLSALHAEFDGVSTEATGAGALTLSVQVDTSMFADDYKSVVMSEDGQVLETRMGAPQCYYRGNVAGGEQGDSFVHLSACSEDRLVHGWVSVGSERYNIEPLREHGVSEEMQVAAKASHVIYRSVHALSMDDEETHGHCGDDDEHIGAASDPAEQADADADADAQQPYVLSAHASSIHDQIHRTLQGANECTDRPNKYVEMLLVNDPSLFAVRRNGLCVCYRESVGLLYM